MSGLLRSSVSFRRQGSSGLVWDDRFLSGDLNEMKKRMEEEQGGRDKRTLRTSKSVNAAASRTTQSNTTTASSSGGGGGGGAAWRASKVSPAVDPPSPKLRGCALCGFFGGSNPPKRTKPRKKRYPYDR